MESNEVVVTNIPVAAFWIIAIAQILFAIATLAIAVVLIMMIGQIKAILNDVSERTPSMLTSVDGTLKNVKLMSDDARGTTHNVTGAVNRVSHVVSSVAGRMESPIIKGVGVLTGVVAGARALRGGKKEKEVIIKETDKKRRR